MKKSNFPELKDSIKRQKKIVKEMISSQNYYKQGNSEEKKIVQEHFNNLLNKLRETNKQTGALLKTANLAKPLPKNEEKDAVHEEKNKDKKETEDKEEIKNKKVLKKSPPHQFEISTPVVLENKYSKKDLKPDKLERETFKRIFKSRRKKKEDKGDGMKGVNPYVQFANKFFSNVSKKLVDDKTFATLERDLIKANMQFTTQEYLSTILLSFFVSIIAAVLIAAFFLFFKITPDLPIIVKAAGTFGSRLLKVSWLVFVVPVGTLLLMFFYPSIEKNSAGSKIDQEMPFATIHMSAISGSMINPTKIFEILITTNEYPKLSKQFTKLINEINIYGYDLVSALRSAAYNSPSKKLSELYNGLATTINSGGDLPEFFEKRSESLLFEYSLEKEKRTKGAETFMDIYISIVIAAPMILMILLMMMKISGLGVSLSTQMITLIMIISVTVINIIFLSFLEVKK